MKRIIKSIAILILLLLVISWTVPAYAEDVQDPGTQTGLLPMALEALVEFITKFKYANIFDALVDIAKAWFTNSTMGEFSSAITDGLDEVLSFLFSSDTFLNATREALWKKMLGLALTLLPLVTILTLAEVLKNGAALNSPDAREQIVRILISVGMACSSLFIMDNLIDLSSAAASRLLGSNSGLGIGIGRAMGNEIIGAVYMSGTVGSSYVLDFLFLVIRVFLIVMVFMSLLFASIAVQISFFILVVLAPLVFVVSAYEELDWLRSLWIKSFTSNCLLLPINGLLLMIMVQSGKDLTSEGNFGAILAGLVVNLAISFTLVSLNSQTLSNLYSGVLDVLGKGAMAVKKIGETAVFIIGTAATGGLSALAGAGSGVAAGTSSVSKTKGIMRSAGSKEISRTVSNGEKSQTSLVRDVNKAAARLGEKYHVSQPLMDQIKQNAIRVQLSLARNSDQFDRSDGEMAEAAKDSVTMISGFMEAQVLHSQGLALEGSSETDSVSPIQQAGNDASVILFDDPALSDASLDQITNLSLLGPRA